MIAIQTKGLSILTKFCKQVFATFEFVFRQNSVESKMAAMLNTISLKAHYLKKPHQTKTDIKVRNCDILHPYVTNWQPINEL